MGRVVVLVALVGCYSPAISPGAPCSVEGACPGTLTCVAGTCQLGPGETDAGPDGPGADAPDAPDAPDAAPDGPSPTWSAPVPVPGVNTSNGESDPTMTADRLTIVFTRSDDLLVGTRGTTAEPFGVAPLVVLNSPFDEQSPELSPDGQTIYFASDRATPGSHSIYISERSGASWTPPALVPELSTASDNGDLAIAPDGLTAIVRDNGFSRATRATTTSAWGALDPLPFDFGNSEAAPSLTAAGDVYYHAGADRDLFVARRSGVGYISPVGIVELNSLAREASPFVAPDERHLVFERDGELLEATR